MKKFLSIILAMAIFTSFFGFNVSAVAYDKLHENEIVIIEMTEYLDDSSSITTIITQQTSNISTMSTTKTITGSKTQTAKNSSGEVLYKFKVTGTFSVNVGISSTCTAVSCSASDCTNGWALDSSTTSKSGNTAKATGIFKKKTLFITTQTKEVSATLTCDKNGTLS